MWIYQRVDGEVHEYFRTAVETLRELGRAWAKDRKGVRLHELVEPWIVLVERCRDRLEPFAQASPEARTLARAAYIATLDLVAFLDAGRNIETLPMSPHVDATFAVLDMLEEWQPYISIEDRALNLMILDGVSESEALVAMQESAREPIVTSFADTCPLCRSMEPPRLR
jgi:hypothetical protein